MFKGTKLRKEEIAIGGVEIGNPKKYYFIYRKVHT